jgi:hypothetical protein
VEENMKTEHVVVMPVRNPLTGWKSRGFVYAGRIDESVIGRIVDYKSTTDPHQFIDKVSISFQTDLYRMAEMFMGNELVHECEYRLISVPGIKFVEKKDGGWAGYEERCFNWLNDPEYPDRLMSHVVPINPAREETAKHYLWDCCARIRLCRRTGIWMPNENACHCWNKRCPYLQLCQLTINDDDVAWAIEQDYEAIPAHPELGEIEIPTGKQIVSYSSCATLTLCEMKYYWRHEQCLQRKATYDSAPWLGSAMHAGIAAFRTGGYEAAVAAIDEWEQGNPAFGEAADAVLQQKHKARAMARAAAERWPA